MTTEIGSPARVLVVGRRVRVLDEVGNTLREAGMLVREETDVDRVRDYIDGATIDIVAIGRAFTGAKRERIITSLRGQNPNIRVVDGLAPIPMVLAAQVQEVVTAADPETRIIEAAAYETAVNSVVLILRRAADVEVTLVRLDPVYRMHKVPVITGPLAEGRHSIPLGRRVGRGERYLITHAVGETTVHHLG